MYLHFNEEGQFLCKTSEQGDGFYSVPAGEGREVGERFKLVDGELEDQAPGLTDEEFILAEAEKQQVAAEKAAALAQEANKGKEISRLKFTERFTMDELVGIYTAAKTEVLVEVFLDKLKLSETVDVTHQDMIAGVGALVLMGLLTEDRGEEVLQ